MNGRKRRGSEGRRMNELKLNAGLSYSASDRKKQGKMNSNVSRDSRSSPKKKSKKEPSVTN